MDNRGQALVEYSLLFFMFTVMAAVGWKTLRPALGALYRHTAAQRAGLEGMKP